MRAFGDRDTPTPATVAGRPRGHACNHCAAGRIPAGVSHVPTTLEEDQALVRDVQAAVPDAFERLVRQYQGLCWHVVQRMVRHPEDARELCQETFLRVHQCLHQWRGDRPLSGWIGQVAYSMAKRHLERKRIPIAEPACEDGPSPMDAVADGFDLEGAVAEEETDRHLHAAIESLPPLQRTLLTLYHLEELPIGEISRITELPENTIKSHLFRSRKRLRELLAPSMGHNAVGAAA